MRTYRYYLIAGRPALPTEARYAGHLWRRPNVQALNDFARCLYGETDCTLFASPSDPIFTRGTGSRCRLIRSAQFFAEADRIVFEISANAFFRRMVRSIIGTLLFYEERGFSQSDFRAILAAGRREDAGPTAPPEGLFLWNIEY
jgi:tRNA pseudouridine38-40 synthase